MVARPIVAAAALALLAACSRGGEGAATPAVTETITVRETVTVTGTVTPAPSPQVVEPATCAAPDLTAPEGAEVLAEDCIGVSLSAGGTYNFDGSSVLVQDGGSPPPCASFGSRFGWATTSEGAPRVVLTTVSQGIEGPVGSGADGAGSGYCGTVRVENPNDGPVTVDLRYLLLDCETAQEAC
ncbi:MAG: hypothetical protein ACRDUY_02580 [Nitriliruptorales bacterium]